MNTTTLSTAGNARGGIAEAERRDALASQPWLDLIARMLVGVLFIVYGLLQATKYAFYVGYMTKFGVPLPELLLAPTIALEVGGGAMIVLGWKMRWAALALAAWVIVVTLFFHRYWELEAAQAAVQMGNFFKNLALAGGLLYMYFHGAGAWSVDAKQRKAAD